MSITSTLIHTEMCSVTEQSTNISNAYLPISLTNIVKQCVKLKAYLASSLLSLPSHFCIVAVGSSDVCKVFKKLY